MEDFIIQNGILEQCLTKDAVIVIPEGVTVIGEGAMKGGSFIEKVILPDSVTEIRADAWKGCRRLKEISIPKSVCYIGDYAFHRCHSLKHIEIPEIVTELGNCVFLYCDSLEYVSMPGVISLGNQVFLNDVNLRKLVLSKNLNVNCICDVFTGCSKLSEIQFADGDTIYVNSMIKFLAERKQNVLVSTIAADVFRMLEIEGRKIVKFLVNIKEIELPEGIEEIGKSCFFDKKGIISVKMPRSLKKIGSRAFRNCINLEQIEFLGEEVEIEEDAFKNCTTLCRIIMPDNRIYERNGLDMKEVPKLVQKINSQVLSDFQISGTILLRYYGKEERVTVPEGITVINERAFAGNEAIDRVILPDSVSEIREEAFTDCLRLQTISLPESLTFIGTAAFENCVKLIRVKLPEKVWNLSDSVFSRCLSLNEIQFGSKLQSIGAFCFYACRFLKQILLPEKLLKIGDLAFYKCVGLKEVSLPKMMKELGNNVFTQSGIRHAEIAGNRIVCGTDVFSQCSKLKKLIFLDGVKEIGDKFAYECKELSSVILPDSIEKIGRNVFGGSKYLKELPEGIEGTYFLSGDHCCGKVTIPEEITVLAGGAFYGNKRITEISLPKNLQSIGARAFCGCSSLSEILLPEGITVLEEGTFAYCLALKTICTEGIIHEIADNAFYSCPQLNCVPLKEVKIIGNHAFFGCESLGEMDLKCTYLGDGALDQTAIFKQSNKIEDLFTVGFVAANGRTCQGTLEIPEGITSISPYAFAGNERLCELVIPESMKEIGEYAFSGCKCLHKITIRSQDTVLGKHAFEKCISLNECNYNGLTVSEGAFYFCTALETIRLNCAEQLGKEAFSGCMGLVNCICSSVQFVGEKCFSGCESLKDLSMPHLHQIEPWAFWGCDSLNKLHFKEEIFIGEHAFEDCGQLSEISVTEDITFGSYTFSGCLALHFIYVNEKSYKLEDYSVLLRNDIPDLIKSIYASVLSCFIIDETKTIVSYRNNGCFVHIPEGILRIERDVFKDADRLRVMTIPSSIVYIGSRAFQGTKWMEQRKKETPLVIINQMLLDGTASSGEVIIKEEVKMICGWAFANCYALTAVRFQSWETKVEEYAFRNCIHLKEIEMPDVSTYSLLQLSDRERELPSIAKQIMSDCYNCFKTEENGKLMECTGNISNLTLPVGITEISSNVFQNSNLLTNITLSNSVVRIGRGAFSDCKWLSTVKQANSVERVEDMAFSGCIRLVSIDFSEKLQYIGKRAFENCVSLEQIIIPEGIEEIKERAFYRCHSLQRVILPSSVKFIGKEAFAFCKLLPNNLTKMDGGCV